MLGFVDNNNITNNGEEWETIHGIIMQTQHNAQLWNDLLQATGGALNLDKCFAQVIAFQFRLNDAPVIALADPNLTITLQDRLYNIEVNRIQAIRDSGYALRCFSVTKNTH
jgi:hypothetical protein